MGPGNIPMKFHNSVTVTYVDLHSQEELKAMYPCLDYSFLDHVVIDDADTLASLEDNKYDFLVASHVIEHVKNPLKALQRWLEVVRPGGYVLIIFPNRDECFDRGRSYTKISHLIEESFLDNDSEEMLRNLEAHILDHYRNTDYRNREDELDHIDIAEQIRLGAAHLHVWGRKNVEGFLEKANQRLGITFRIVTREHRMKELRYLLRKE